LVHLFEIPPTRVTCWVIGQKAKDKQANKEGDNDIHNNFKSQHKGISQDEKLKETAILIADNSFSSYRNVVPFLAVIV
jgi:hypothetical protein